MVAGDLVLSAALVEQGGDPLRPHTTATRQGDGWRLDGTKSFVPAGMVAGAIVVSARTDDGIGLFVVDPTAPGVSRRAQEATSRQIEAELEFAGCRGRCRRRPRGRRRTASTRCGGCSSTPRPRCACVWRVPVTRR